MSRILVAAKLPEGTELFGESLAWGYFLTIVKNRFKIPVEPAHHVARGRGSRIDDYVVIRTTRERGTSLIDDVNSPLTIEVNTYSDGTERPYCTEAALIDMYGPRGHWQREGKRHFEDRMDGIGDVLSGIFHARGPNQIFLTIDIMLTTDIADVVQPVQGEKFYVHGKGTFADDYRAQLPDAVKQHETTL
ncbi:hypothetical protein ACFLZ6_02270 [Nanoarchaeota archaeon]